MSAALAAVKSVGVLDAAGEELAEFLFHDCGRPAPSAR